MTNPMTQGLAPTHPGEVLREDVLPAMDITKTRLAQMLGVSRQTVHSLVSEKQPVTVEMALRLGKLFGNGPEVWINLQSNYDLKTQAPRMETALAAIPTLEMEHA